MQMTPYLNFPGTCAEAFELYARVFNGQLELQKHADSPYADQVAPEWRDRVIHARLVVGGSVLMGSDMPPDQVTQPQGMHIALVIPGAEETERIFTALSVGGTVTMPLEPSFWAERFGMLVDRFGIPWMLSSDKPAETPATAEGA